MAARAAKIDHVSLRTFVHATEDPTKVERALFFAAGASDAKGEEAVRKNLASTPSRGHWGNPIHILELEVSKNRLIRALLDHLLSTSLRDVLRREMRERLDEDLILYLRLAKQEAYAGRLELAEGDDVIHVRIKVATYPKDREAALAHLAELLS